MVFGKIFSRVGKAVNQLTGAERAGDQNAELQREFARTGVQWRAADAKAAGIHPLAALGASLPSATGSYRAGGDLGDFVSAGQNISRAINASRTAGQRVSAEQVQYERLEQDKSLQRMDLENELLQQQIASNNVLLGQPGTPPSMAAASAEVDAGRLPSLGENAPTWQFGPSMPAERVEQEYGDVVGWGYGAGRSLVDARSNVRRWLREAWQNEIMDRAREWNRRTGPPNPDVRMIRPARGY